MSDDTTETDTATVPSEVTEEPARASEAFKSRLSPGGEIASVQTPEEILAAANAAKKNRWLAIFIQLSRCERFLKFVEMNYVIQDKIDEATNTIETSVYENPRAVGPAMQRAQHAKIYALLKMYGTRHADKVYKELMAVLGQNEDKPALISSANQADLDDAVKQASLKVKLD